MLAAEHDRNLLEQMIVGIYKMRFQKHIPHCFVD